MLAFSAIQAKTKSFPALSGEKQRMILSPSLTWQPKGLSGSFALGNVSGWHGNSSVRQITTQGGYFYTPWFWAGPGVQVYGSTLEGATSLNGTSLYVHGHFVFAKPFEHGVAFGLLGRLVSQNLEVFLQGNEEGINTPSEAELEFQEMTNEAVAALTWASGKQIHRNLVLQTNGEWGLNTDWNPRATAAIGLIFDLKRVFPQQFQPASASHISFQTQQHWPLRNGFEGLIGLGFGF